MANVPTLPPPNVPISGSAAPTQAYAQWLQGIAQVTQPATSSALGVVQPDGTTIISSNGTISAAGALVSVNRYSGTQTVTIPSATTAFGRIWGSTGGSGGAASSCASAGTGAAGYSEFYLTDLTAGNTLAYTQGGAGGAGTSAPTNGGNGAASTLASGTQTISTITANGSAGTVAASTTSPGTITTGSSGGTASGGTLNITGQPGGNSVVATSGIPIPGGGGATVFSFGAAGVGTSGSATGGNVGQPGGLIITWFS